MALNVQCKKCANLRNDWCKLVVDSPDPDMVRDCKYYRGKTNADRLRQLTDEELADFIARQRFSVVNPIADKLGIDVTTAFIVGRKNALDWLKQEVESDG